MKRCSPLFGRVLDVQWKPVDRCGVAGALTSDPVIRSDIMKLGRWFKDPIVSSWGSGYWLIRGGINTDLRSSFFVPSRKEWALYETIARRLLNASLAI